MKYRIECFKKNGKLCSINHFEDLIECENFGFNHQKLEEMFSNTIPSKDRMFIIFETTSRKKIKLF